MGGGQAVGESCCGSRASLHALATAARQHRDLPLLAVFGVTVRDPVVGDLVSDALHLRGLEPAAVAELAALRVLPKSGTRRPWAVSDNFVRDAVDLRLTPVEESMVFGGRAAGAGG
jgi:hypothetical protein